ncbi:hypothetical protein CDAR_102021 [Caerostris darwini]|uniref:Uncharacterized protein n=1 Tax=Caerostris darwini TaxID=1538125 RepID=A0AAV4MCD0_9ARAC|nr:hypothetical protein CDAR_102021 [Caerostris darwini]
MQRIVVGKLGENFEKVESGVREDRCRVEVATFRRGGVKVVYLRRGGVIVIYVWSLIPVRNDIRELAVLSDVTKGHQEEVDPLRSPDTNVINKMKFY